MTADRRSLEQNAILWSRLGEIARHVEWHGKKLSPMDWSDLFTDLLRKMRMVPSMKGGRAYVRLGLHTSDMSRDEMSRLLALIEKFALEQGLTFNEAHPRPPLDNTGEAE